MEIIDGARYLAGWYWTCIKWEARETWSALPGPWWVKVAIIVGCAAIPGQLDEIAVIALCKFFRARKTRREALPWVS